MSDRRALYRRASLFEQRRPLICDMLCSSITRRSPSTCTRLVCLPISSTLPIPRTHSRTHTSRLVCGSSYGSSAGFWQLLLYFSSCVIEKAPQRCPSFPMFFLTAQASQMDILIGTFGTVSILRWNGRQVSGWRGRAQADWCVASRA